MQHHNRSLSKLSSASSDMLDQPAWRAQARRNMDENYGDDVEGCTDDPAGAMFEFSVADAMTPRAEDSKEMLHMKNEVRSLAAACLPSPETTARRCKCMRNASQL